MKIVILAKELERNIEQFIIELYNIKKINSYKQIIVIDLNKEDDIDKIKMRFCDSEVNVDVLSYKDGEEYMQNFFDNEYVSFL